MRALFLDRDGVINVDVGYPSRLSELYLYKDTIDFSHRMKNKGYIVIVITNQSGIARGFFTMEDLHTFHKAITDIYRIHQVEISEWFICPHGPNTEPMNQGANCKCRKPEPQLIFDAARKYQIDLHNSIMVGDKDSDMMAASAAGVGRKILVTRFTSNGTGNSKVECEITPSLSLL